MYTERTITIDHDALVAAYDQAHATCTDSRWGNALLSAYEALTQMAIDGIPVVFDARAHMRVESASEPGKFYWVNGVCQCQAHSFGKPCHHRAMRQLVCRMLEVQAKPVRTAATKAKAYREMAELF